ncbi:response regulator transcription factor [Paenibacillus harenae]|uniref:Two-component system response regulator YesN n=1 Tax=Paenibacillus harenae TaxID=306543 RepID=A0ABT9TWJ8_PAEHA|nr:response regulator [Paenibacillus harenae]MDQ0111462.1 two-component system response regulator YesN [Paenibacillus harenae]
MKKIMLVDDEILVRESIRDCINWEKEGFIYCGDASDGEVALPLIEQLEPDILITDIKMPFMNGIELSEIVRTRMPDIKIIILSGHDEFEYARAALRVGAMEYCLKPVSAADIIRLLQETSKVIDRERLEREQRQLLLQLQSDYAVKTQHKLLNDLCCGLIATAEAMHTAALLNVALYAKHYVVAVTDFRCHDGRARLVADKLQEAEQFLSSELSRLPIEPLSYKRSHTETVWLLKGQTAPQLEEALHYLQAGLKNQIEKLFPCTLALGTGSIQERLQGVHASYLDAEDDKHWRRLSQHNRLALFQAASSAQGQSAWPDRQRFIDFLKLGAEHESAGLLSSLADSLRSVDWRDSFYGYYLLNDYTIEVLKTAHELHFASASPAETMEQFEQKMNKVRSADEARAYLQWLLSQYWQWRSDASDKYTEMLEQAKSYIAKNYGNDQLTLQDVADHVMVSPSHLSKVFSQECGQTFIEFLTQTRIRKAKELLLSTSSKSYEIAHRVGYNDAHYFSNLFKRITGITTTQYRKQQLLGNGSVLQAQGAMHENGKH